MTFTVLAVQLLFLLFFETRIASGVLEKKFSDGLFATLTVAVATQYVTGVAAPLLAAWYPDHLQESAKLWIIAFIAGFSFLHTTVVFHYSITHVTKFKGRSLLVFPQAVYEKDPASVRRVWIRIFNLIGLTSMVLVSAVHAYAFFGVSVTDSNWDATRTLSYLLGLTLVFFSAQPIRNAILRFPSSLVLTAKLNEIMAKNAKSAEFRRSLSTRKSDPISWARKELVSVSRMLERMARREDSVSGPDAPHPIAAIYRAVADEVRQYCSSPKSIEGAIPATLVTTLKMTEGLMITGDATWRRQLIKRLKVFNADETPRALKTAPAPASTLRAVTNGARLLDRSLVWVQSRWTAIVAVVAVIALLLGAINVEQLLGVAV
ncbi:hypothetical protein OHA21_23015 [Actinoplanes sp. NBC_00393]|uniref:hypothetical protein n=1 Tax=Actinoplanes sp. NBC_00393 TaxID=2975953 RepID=UPI002E1A259E